MKTKTISDLPIYPNVLDGTEEIPIWALGATYKTPLTGFSHTLLSNKGVNTHLQIDTFIASKGQVNGIASLSGTGKLIQDADTLDTFHASQSAGANQIPVLNAGGRLLLGATDDTVNKLQVNGSATVSSILKVGTTTVSKDVQNGDLVLRRTPNTGAIYFGDSSSNHFYFDGSRYRFGLGNLYITANGNTLINSTTDDGVNELQVSGSASFVNGYEPGTITANTFSLYSKDINIAGGPIATAVPHMKLENGNIIKFYKSHTLVPAPTGGSVIDVEARAAIGGIISILQEMGFMYTV